MALVRGILFSKPLTGEGCSGVTAKRPHRMAGALIRGCVQACTRAQCRNRVQSLLTSDLEQLNVVASTLNHVPTSDQQRVNGGHGTMLTSGTSEAVTLLVADTCTYKTHTRRTAPERSVEKSGRWVLVRMRYARTGSLS